MNSEFSEGKRSPGSEIIVSQAYTSLDFKLGTPDADLWLRDELNEEVIDIAENAKESEELDTRIAKFMEAHHIALNALHRLYETEEYQVLVDDEDVDEEDRLDEETKEKIAVYRSSKKLRDLEQNFYMEAYFLDRDSENPKTQ